MRTIDRVREIPPCATKVALTVSGQIFVTRAVKVSCCSVATIKIPPLSGGALPIP